MRYYRLAAEQGHAPAQCIIGRLYILGSLPEVPRQPKEGALFLARAAQQTEDERAARWALESLAKCVHDRDVVHPCCIGCGRAKKLKLCSKCHVTHVAKFCGAGCVQRM